MLQMDDSALLKVMPQKSVTTSSRYNRGTDAPIKRLKSAMIKSVFALHDPEDAAQLQFKTSHLQARNAARDNRVIAYGDVEDRGT